ncbi:LIM domain-containing protein [Bacillus sp. SL00103]
MSPNPEKVRPKHWHTACFECKECRTE